MTKSKKLIATVGAGLILTAMLAGCGSQAPKTAADLLKKSQENSQSNCHMKGDMGMDMTMNLMSMDFEVPVTMTMDMDMVDKNAHGTCNVDVSYMGEETNTDMEMYIAAEDDTYTTYVRESDGDSWTKAEQTMGVSDVYGMGNDFLAYANFDDAEMVHDEKAKTYTVTTKMSSLLENDEYKESMESYYSSYFESLGIGEDEVDTMLESMGDADVTYVFNDSDYTLSSVSMSDVSYSTTMEIESVEVALDVTTNMSYEFSDYGKISADDVAVPDDVVNAASAE